MQGVKHDEGKTRVDLVPVWGIEAAARAFAYGAEKYESWNWLKGFEWLRLYAAVLRHLFAWAKGEDVDRESGLHHLDHAMADLMMLQAHAVQGLGEDNRPALVENECLPPEAFASFDTPQPQVWRIALLAAGRRVESGYFEEERYSSYEEAKEQLTAAELELFEKDRYVIEQVG